MASGASYSPLMMQRRQDETPRGGNLPSWMGYQGSLSTYQPSLRETVMDSLRRTLFTDDRAGQDKADRLSNVMETMTPYGLMTGVNEATRSASQGDYAPAGLMAGLALLPGPDPKITAGKGFKAYHGSPHDFDRFDLSKIGTGEGAQAYGHGLYFAENEEIARYYRDALSGVGQWGNYRPPNKGSYADRIASLFGNDGSKFSKNGRDITDIARSIVGRPKYEDGLDVYEFSDGSQLRVSDGGWDISSPPSPGFMYEVQINADPSHFLDWDKPLSEQGPIVQNAAKEIQDIYGSMGTNALSGDVRGSQLAQIMASKDLSGSPVRASQDLSAAGFPGIKYLDSGSRAAGDGSRNYVVFNDKLIEILRKYGLAGLLPAGAAAATMTQPQQTTPTTY